MFSQSLTTATLRHANVRLILVWTPVDQDLDGQRVARHMASEACKREPPDGLDRVQPLSRRTGPGVARFNNGKISDGLAPSSPTSAGVYWVKTPSPTPAVTLSSSPRSTTNTIRFGPNLSTRRTTSAVLQVATDHAFTSTYTQRFRPNDPP
ncbi:hypothetical protein EDB85DRAFT_2146737 [Lactarius pseudohatsudake]|nr:hypothetical protein EDB85DRAFT_2146737 [Lactarius pseudohatsudake]